MQKTWYGDIQLYFVARHSYIALYIVKCALAASLPLHCLAKRVFIVCGHPPRARATTHALLNFLLNFRL
jgi:hypothetical protein